MLYQLFLAAVGFIVSPQLSLWVGYHSIHATAREKSVADVIVIWTLCPVVALPQSLHSALIVGLKQGFVDVPGNFLAMLTFAVSFKAVSSSLII